ncbi:MAG: hypothetical protein ACRDF4_09175, partial [Rhabdochlamydiaceae bacterium]
EFEEFTKAFGQLSILEKAELLELLSSVEPRDISRLPKRASNPRLRSILHFYKPIAKEAEEKIWRLEKHVDYSPVPEDERVEDAGLSDFQDDEQGPDRAQGQTKVAMA